MKILFIATVDIHIQAFHLNTIHLLNEIGHTVDVAAFGSYTNSDITHKYNLSFSKNPLNPKNIKAYLDLKKILKNERYDIISCHTPISSFFARIAARNIKNIKVIYTAHGFHFYQGCPLINKLIYKTMEKIAAHYTDILVTINKEDYQSAKQFKLKPTGKVKHIPGVGVDVDSIKSKSVNRSKKRKELGFAEKDFLILSVGEINTNKNHQIVINALKNQILENCHYHYLVCGTGPLLEELQKLVRNLELENQIHFLGFRNDVIEIMKVCDLFIFPSYREGLPVSIIEAMACSLPIIASDIRGNQDLIKHKSNGLLYPAANQALLLKSFQELAEDHQYRNQLSSQASIDAEQYSLKAVQEQILELYK